MKLWDKNPPRMERKEPRVKSAHGQNEVNGKIYVQAREVCFNQCGKCFNWLFIWAPWCGFCGKP